MQHRTFNKSRKLDGIFYDMSTQLIQQYTGASSSPRLRRKPSRATHSTHPTLRHRQWHNHATATADSAADFEKQNSGDTPCQARGKLPDPEQTWGFGGKTPKVLLLLPVSDPSPFCWACEVGYKMVKGKRLDFRSTEARGLAAKSAAGFSLVTFFDQTKKVTGEKGGTGAVPPKSCYIESELTGVGIFYDIRGLVATVEYPRGFQYYGQEE